MNRAVKVQGIECPMIREGDNLVDIVVDSVLNAVQVPENISNIIGYWYGVPVYKDGYIPKYYVSDKDIIGITESVVARAAGQYVTVDDIANNIEKKFGKDATICLVNPIYSRNRFSMILKGIARAAKKVFIVMPEYDEVGNPRGVNPFTGVNIEDYYKKLVESESRSGVNFQTVKSIGFYDFLDLGYNIDGCIYCGLHDYKEKVEQYQNAVSDWRNSNLKIYSLADICSDKSPDWGLLGTNKATEEKLKFFPSKSECQRVCEEVKAKIKEKTEKDVIVCVYGDGCFKDPVGGIWEFADPVTMPGYTDPDIIESTPHEIKLKALIDSNDKGDFTNDEDLKSFLNRCKSETQDRKDNMSSQGTTPRLFRDLLASLMDLTSGSGDRATPVILVSNYF